MNQEICAAVSLSKNEGQIKRSLLSRPKLVCVVKWSRAGIKILGIESGNGVSNEQYLSCKNELNGWRVRWRAKQLFLISVSALSRLVRFVERGRFENYMRLKFNNTYYDRGVHYNIVMRGRAASLGGRSMSIVRATFIQWCLCSSPTAPHPSCPAESLQAIGV